MKLIAFIATIFFFWWLVKMAGATYRAFGDLEEWKKNNLKRLK